MNGSKGAQYTVSIELLHKVSSLGEQLRHTERIVCSLSEMRTSAMR